MVYMLFLSWVGVRVKKVITGQTELFSLQQCSVILLYIRAYGVIHNDAEWRNILWNEETNSLVVIEPSLKPCHKGKVGKTQSFTALTIGQIARKSCDTQGVQLAWQ